MDLGPSELLIILAVVLVLFGGAKLPKLARSLGQAKTEFERGAAGGHRGEPGTEAAPAATPDEQTVTMSRAELDDLVQQRVQEATQARPEDQPPRGP